MQMDVRKKLADRITWYRERAGMSQRALADELKIDKATIWRAEQGEGWPDFKTLEAIAKALHIGVEKFFEWEAVAQPKLELLELAASLDDDQAEGLLAMADNMGLRSRKKLASRSTTHNSAKSGS